MLSTFKVVGTKTPENVPSLPCPPTGRGKEPILGPPVLLSLPSFFLMLCICAVKEALPRKPWPDFCLPLDDRVFKSGGCFPEPCEFDEPFVNPGRCGSGREASGVGSSGLPEGPESCNGVCGSSVVVDKRLKRWAASSVAVCVGKLQLDHRGSLLSGVFLIWSDMIIPVVFRVQQIKEELLAQP